MAALSLGGAQHLLRYHADIRHVQILMGHAALSSTEVYFAVEAEGLARMIETSHPRAPSLGRPAE